MPVAEPVAVVDLGSNSGRLVVYRQVLCGQLDILEDARVPLRLARDREVDRQLSQAAIDRTLDALRDFQAISRGVGVRRMIVVGTAAMREAPNSGALIERARQELGLDIELIDGLAEARYALLGAIHSLPVSEGFILDIGGGSLELSQFRDRRAVQAWSLPLGALALSAEHLISDPPTGRELRALRRQVKRTLAALELPPLGAGQALIGTGGTIRNLAKIDKRARRYPIQRLHGYLVPRERVRLIARALARQPLAARATTPGLNPDRADSIVGGAIAAEVAMSTLGAGELQVSGMGLREGIAFAAIGTDPPPPDEVRRASIAGLTARFRDWDQHRAERRRTILAQLMATLAPDAGDEIREAASYAATVLDIGRSVDYYNRLSHTASIITVAGLGGFSHRGIALLTAIIAEADRKQTDLRTYAPLLGEDDLLPVARAGALLAAADELERRFPDAGPVGLTIETDDVRVVLRGPAMSGSQAAKLGDRLGRVFGPNVLFHDEGG